MRACHDSTLKCATRWLLQPDEDAFQTQFDLITKKLHSQEALFMRCAKQNTNSQYELHSFQDRGNHYSFLDNKGSSGRPHPLTDVFVECPAWDFETAYMTEAST